MAATAASSLSYALLLLRWHGHTGIWEALYIIPGGLGTGMVQAAIFVSIQAAVDPAHKAPAMAGNFLVVTAGAMVGMVTANAVLTNTMQWELDARLSAMRLDRTAREKASPPPPLSLGRLVRAVRLTEDCLDYRKGHFQYPLPRRSRTGHRGGSCRGLRPGSFSWPRLFLGRRRSGPVVLRCLAREEAIINNTTRVVGIPRGSPLSRVFGTYIRSEGIQRGSTGTSCLPPCAL